MKETLKTQVCTKCGLEKPLSEYSFRKDRQKYKRECKECAKKKQAVYREANREKVRACYKAWRDANLEKARAKYKAWRDANLEKKQAYDKAWQKANFEKISTHNKAKYEANKEKYRLKNRAYRKANKGIVNANRAKRRAAKLQATPAWADLKKIAQIYKDCPPGYHIDHYFPLQSPIMCGLHVESNLQYLPAKENISKGNRVSLEQQLNG